MATKSTKEEVLEAARSLGPEFTREDVAKKLGVEVSVMRPSWKAAKEAGELEEVRSDDNQRYFGVAAS
jgi:hypothetical protein